MRDSLRRSHNQTMELERLSGVRLGSLQQSVCEQADQQKEFKLKFKARKTKPRNHTRDLVLSQPKVDYQGQDFFQRADFRGLLLADY